jgi:hypothetical protein
MKTRASILEDQIIAVVRSQKPDPLVRAAVRAIIDQAKYDREFRTVLLQPLHDYCDFQEPTVLNASQWDIIEEWVMACRSLTDNFSHPKVSQLFQNTIYRIRYTDATPS